MLCVLTVLLLIFSLPAFGAPAVTKEQVDQLNKRVESFSKQAEEMKKKVEEIEKKVDREKLQQIYDYVHSEEFQNRVNNYSKQIIEWTGKAGNKNAQKDLQFFKKQLEKAKSRQQTWTLIAFLSSSMGTEIDTYLGDLSVLIEKQAEKFGKLYLVPYGALRGLVPLKKGQRATLKTTVLWLQKKLAGKEVQVLIDPVLFRQYGVDRVPCLLLTKYSAVEQRTCSESYFGCGYSVFGFLDKVESSTDNQNLKKLIRELER